MTPNKKNLDIIVRCKIAAVPYRRYTRYYRDRKPFSKSQEKSVDLIHNIINILCATALNIAKKGQHAII